MRYRTAYPNELCHYGVLGMHWGVRRYQNYDGTRIASGSPPVKNPNSLKGGSQRLHLGTGEIQRTKAGGFKNTIVGGQGGKAKGTARLAAKAPSTSEVLFGPQIKKGKDKEKSSNVKEMLKDIGDAAEGAGKLADHAKKRDKKVREANEKQKKQRQKEAKQMSDKELRDSINRIKMEREYESLTTKEVETGYDKFKEVMGEVKDVAVTAAAVAGLVLTIIKIKKSLGHSEMTEDQRNELNSFIEIGDYDDEFIAHAMDLDLEYVIDYFDLSDDFLAHYGVLGQKWGVRRYQNYDGTRIGTGSGVGGSKGSGSIGRNIAKKVKKFDTSRLASKTSDSVSKYKNANTQKAVDAWKKHEEIYWNEVDPARDEYFKLNAKYGANDPRTKKAQDKMVAAWDKSDKYSKIAVDNFKNIPYDDIDDDVLSIGQHASTWKYDVKVEDIDNYDGPTVRSWSTSKQDYEVFKFESQNPNIEILGDAPGGEIALRRRPKNPDPIADAKAAKKRKEDLAKSEIQDLKDAYKITGDKSFLQAAKDRERKIKRR